MLLLGSRRQGRRGGKLRREEIDVGLTFVSVGLSGWDVVSSSKIEVLGEGVGGWSGGDESAVGRVNRSLRDGSIRGSVSHLIAQAVLHHGFSASEIQGNEERREVMENEGTPRKGTVATVPPRLKWSRLASFYLKTYSACLE